MQGSESSKSPCSRLADIPRTCPAFLCPAQTQSPRKAISLHCFNKHKQIPPCPQATLGLCRDKDATPGFRGFLLLKVTSPTNQYHSQGNLLMVHVPFHWGTHSRFWCPKKEREKNKGIVIGTCIQNYVWIFLMEEDQRNSPLTGELEHCARGKREKNMKLSCS